MSHIMIYMTCSGESEAMAISKTLLEQKLIACANIMSPHRTLYHWEGELESGEEVVVIMKTKADLFDAVQEAASELHSYDCPCIVSWSVEKGHLPFLEWIDDSCA